MPKLYHATKAETSQKLLRMNIIAQLWRRGSSYREMKREVMARLNLKAYSLKSVKDDVDAVLAEWREQRLDNMDDSVQLELARCDEIIKEAWAAWEKSKEDYKKAKARQEGIPGAQTPETQNILVNKVIQEREDVRACGDPRYLDAINKQLIERRKLLGLYAPEKQQVENVSFADFLVKTGQKDDEQQ